jgi:Leucine-rich repeat (LRR) protein
MHLPRNTFSAIKFFVIFFVSCISCQLLPDKHPTPYPSARISYVHGIPANEYDALENFYESLGGKYWTWHQSNESHWIFSPRANPCYDDWEGLTCDCVNNNYDDDCNIVEIDLQRYNLTGVISPSISNLTFLTTLELNNNHIIDPLPETLRNLTLLSILSLSNNNLTSMSAVIYSCNNLVSLDLSSNQITDIISPGIANLVNLKDIDLQHNYFYSSLPLEFYRNLTSLENVILNHNQFTGTIPKEIRYLQFLVHYEIGGNVFFGTIPEEFPFSGLLEVLNLGLNLFSQSLPKSSKNATLIFSLFLNSNGFTGPYNFLSPNTNNIVISNNFFSGSIDFLNDSILLTQLVLSNNLFSGSALLSLSRFPLLSSYQLSTNYFTGHFFCSSLISDLLSEVSIGSNFFSGSLSSNMTSIPSSLAQLNVSMNLFSGAVSPITLIKSSYLNPYIGLQTLDLSYNLFTNHLPDLNTESAWFFSFLYFVSFSNNEFSGQIPTNYSHFKVSADLFFNNNLLSGPLSDVLSLFPNSKIVNLELSNNIFTGILSPADFFSTNQKMTLFDISNNCLTGSIPENFCDLNNLESLNLDGSSSSSHCRIFLFPERSVFNSFISANSLQSSIPLCLFSLPNIQTLHLSGNGLSGSLSNNLNASRSLVDLSLSHNQLTGPIPISLQTKSNWQSLDLSYNKFSGTFSSSFYIQNEASLLSFQLNRISGKIPSSILFSSITSLSVLEGNLFYCSTMDKSSTLPLNDEDYNNYSCSSDTAFLIIILWSSVFGVTGICLLTLCDVSRNQVPLMIQELLSQIQSWRSSLPSSLSPVSCPSDTITCEKDLSIQLSLLELTTYFTSIEKFVFIVCLFLVLLILPLWVVLKKYYATYTFQYLWTVGALFLSGEVAGIIMLVIFCLSSLFLFYCIENLSGSNHSVLVNRLRIPSTVIPEPTTAPSTDPSLPAKRKLQTVLYALYFLIFLLDSFVMLLVDVLFILAVLNVSAAQLVLVEVIVAIIRVWINNSFLWNIIPFCANRLERLAFYLTKDSLFSGEGETSVKLEHLVNKIYFIGVLMIINKILYPILVIMIILPDCFFNAFFQAPTVTSSSIYETCYYYEGGYCYEETTNVATSSFVPPFTYYYLCSSNLIIYYTSVYVWTFFFIGVVIPAVKLVVKYLYDKFNLEEGENIKEEMAVDSKESNIVLLLLRKGSHYLVLNRFKKYRPSPRLEVLPLFSVDRFICQVNSYLAFMFCFGLLFPPLGIIAGISILLIINFEYLTLGKLLKDTRELGYDWYEKELAEECTGILQSLRSTIGWMIFISCLLFSLFVFDSIGDEAGWKIALVGMIITIIFPVLMLNIYWNIQYWGYSFRSSHKTRDSSKNEIELRDTSSAMVENAAVVENPIRN